MNEKEDRDRETKRKRAASESCIIIYFVQFRTRLTNKLATLSMDEFPQSFISSSNEL